MINVNALKRMLWTLLPAAIIFSSIVYILNTRPMPSTERDSLPGKALASFDAYYPIGTNTDGSLFLDVSKFMKAVDFFSTQLPSRAAGELIYLGKGNSIALKLSDTQKKKYTELLNNPAYAEYKNIHLHFPMQTYKNIVNGIGQTFSGAGVEIVLHDTRNPLKSIIAIQNSITGRRLGDSTTNFGYQLIKSYSLLDEEGPNHIAYELTSKDGRKVKATTIPLYYDKALIGFICLNIDISKLDGNNREAEAALINAFSATSEKEKIDEIIAPGIAKTESSDFGRRK